MNEFGDDIHPIEDPRHDTSTRLHLVELGSLRLNLIQYEKSILILQNPI